MSMVDPLADMYTRIRNAGRAGKDVVDIPASKIKESISKVLKEEGFIENYKVLEDKKQGIIRIKLKYGMDRKSVITNIKQVSRPGLRVYAGEKDVPNVLGGLGIAVVTTSTGVLTDKECRAKKTGGEVLCCVW